MRSYVSFGYHHLERHAIIKAIRPLILFRLRRPCYGLSVLSQPFFSSSGQQNKKWRCHCLHLVKLGRIALLGILLPCMDGPARLKSALARLQPFCCFSLNSERAKIPHHPSPQASIYRSGSAWGDILRWWCGVFERQRYLHSAESLLRRILVGCVERQNRGKVDARDEKREGMQCAA